MALRALGFEPAKNEIKRLIKDLDKPQKKLEIQDREKEGLITVDWQDFQDIMTTKMSERDADKQLEQAFIIFSNNKDHITLEDLRYVATELEETMTDDELKEMIAEANLKSREGVVTLPEFMSILEKPL